MLNAGTVAAGNMTEGRNIACILDFEMEKGEELIVKTGISAVDEAGAAGNLIAEVPGWDFDGHAAAAQQAWQKRLGVIRAASADSSVLKVFYTALYHSMIAPNLYSDADGRYRGQTGRYTMRTDSPIIRSFRCGIPIVPHTRCSPSQLRIWCLTL